MLDKILRGRLLVLRSRQGFCKKEYTLYPSLVTTIKFVSSVLWLTVALVKGLWLSKKPAIANCSAGLHCFCGRRDESWMINCDGCKSWQHGRCVGLKKEDGDCNWGCAYKTCTEVKGMRTTWLVPCNTLLQGTIYLSCKAQLHAVCAICQYEVPRPADCRKRPWADLPQCEGRGQYLYSLYSLRKITLRMIQLQKAVRVLAKI